MIEILEIIEIYNRILETLEVRSKRFIIEIVNIIADTKICLQLIIIIRFCFLLGNKEKQKKVLQRNCKNDLSFLTL